MAAVYQKKINNARYTYLTFLNFSREVCILRKSHPEFPGETAVKLVFRFCLAAGSVAIIAVAGGVAARAFTGDPPTTDEIASSAAAATDLHPVIIRLPAAPAWVDSGRVDIQGNPVLVSCSTCHATLKPEDLDTVDESSRFHQGLEVTHGQVSCGSCHDRSNFDRLALADGTGVDFTDVMTLCSQCHGTQARDYHHGSHGGMTGTSCPAKHDPNTPKSSSSTSLSPSLSASGRSTWAPARSTREPTTARVMLVA